VEFLVKVKVLAFARYRELLGFAETELPLPDPPPTLSELLKHPIFAVLPENALFAINQKFVNGSESLRPGDEIAIMPPVSGG
jgi:molybdopterin synthase catalytic subunit